MKNTNISFEDLIKAAQYMATMSGVPIRVFKGNEKRAFLCHLPLVADPFDLFRGGMDQFGFGAKIIDDNNYYYAIVSNDDIHVVIGPLGEHLNTKEDNALSAAKKLLSNDRDLARLKTQAERIHCMSIYKLISVVCMTHLGICGTPLDGGDVDLGAVKPEDFGASEDPDLFDYYQKINQYGRGFDLTAREELGERLVLEGRVRGLRHMLENSVVADYLPRFHENEVDNAKASLYYAASIVLGSLSRSSNKFTEADILRRKYFKRCKALTDTKSVLELKTAMLLDFASKFGGGPEQLHYSRLTLDAIDFIEHNLNSPIDTSDVANELFVSRSRISTIFKRDTGTNLSDYIHIKKLEAAKAMLSSGSYSIGNIANNLAYRSQSHFTSVFKKFEGVTPKRYRKEHLAKAAAEDIQQ